MLELAAPSHQSRRAGKIPCSSAAGTGVAGSGSGGGGGGAVVVGGGGTSVVVGGVAGASVVGGAGSGSASIASVASVVDGEGAGCSDSGAGGGTEEALGTGATEGSSTTVEVERSRTGGASGDAGVWSGATAATTTTSPSGVDPSTGVNSRGPRTTDATMATSSQTRRNMPSLDIRTPPFPVGPPTLRGVVTKPQPCGGNYDARPVDVEGAGRAKRRAALADVAASTAGSSRSLLAATAAPTKGTQAGRLAWPR